MEVAKIVSFLPWPLEAQKSWCLKYVDPSKVEFIKVEADLTEDEVCEAVTGAAIITASASAQIMGRIIERLSECVRRVLAGEQPRFLVTA